MRKTIEATWREGFLNPDALVAPKVNDLYTRKSRHIVDRIQRMQRINEIAIVIGAPIVWAFLSAVGMPYTGAIMCTAWVGLIVVRRLSTLRSSTRRTAALTAITTSRRSTGG